MATREKPPFFIRLLSFCGQLALFFGLFSLFAGPDLLPMHRMPADMHWLADGGSLISIGIFLLMLTLFYRFAMLLKRLFSPQAVAGQPRNQPQNKHNGNYPTGGWREGKAPRPARQAPAARARKDDNAPLQRNKPDEPAVRGRRANSPLIRR